MSLLPNGMNPYPSMRPKQVEVIDEIIRNWDKKKVFLVEAPTGVGKSGVCLALSNFAGSSYVLTSTKVLQDQYVTEFDKLVKNLKGKGNYTCAINPNFSVETSPCQVVTQQKEFCFNNNLCPYINAKKAALTSKNAVTSYAYFLSAVECGPFKSDNYPDWAIPRRRGVVVCDEGHELTSTLSDFSSILLDPEELREKFSVDVPEGDLFSGSDKEVLERVEEVAGSLSVRLETVRETINNTMNSAAKWFGNDLSRANKEAASQISELVRVRDELDRKDRRLNWFRSRKNNSDWIVSPLDGGSRVKISPTKPAKIFEEFLRPMGERVIIMSATLGSPKSVMEELGLSDSETLYVSTDSPFDPAKSPVKIIPDLDLSYKSIDRNLSDAVELISAILDDHPNEKGIIHTGNYKITRAVLEKSKLPVRQRLIGKVAGGRGSESNEDLVQQHKESTRPTVLISPSMYTGVDLSDEYSRFQIVVKLPWANTSDPMVSYKMGAYRDWYANEMLKKLVQSCGRSTRSEDDYSTTYVLDKSFQMVWNRNRGLFPSWFAKRLVFL